MLEIDSEQNDDVDDDNDVDVMSWILHYVSLNTNSAAIVHSVCWNMPVQVKISNENINRKDSVIALSTAICSTHHFNG